MAGGGRRAGGRINLWDVRNTDGDSQHIEPVRRRLSVAIQKGLDLPVSRADGSVFT